MSKMEGISVKLPLVYSKQDGPYALNKNLEDALKQNFKNLLLTSPGERVMLPDFGVGMRRFLFEGINGNSFSKITSEIQSQVDRYLPFINIEDVRFITNETNPELSLNEVRVTVQYNIGSIVGSNTLQISQVND
jgi:uncharacterized protein|tara:strand:+ start:73 stop:474 length:402 start_codon:yes stop_codon:yes gene_type:complete